MFFCTQCPWLYSLLICLLFSFSRHLFGCSSIRQLPTRAPVHSFSSIIAFPPAGDVTRSALQTKALRFLFFSATHTHTYRGRAFSLSSARTDISRWALLESSRAVFIYREAICQPRPLLSSHAGRGQYLGFAVKPAGGSITNVAGGVIYFSLLGVPLGTPIVFDGSDSSFLFIY